MKELIRDQKGSFPIVFFLILLPLLTSIWLCNTGNERIVESVSVDLADAVALATRSAASMVDERSQANGEPLIVPSEAYDMFYLSLCSNLGLDPFFEPKTGSRMATAPDFEMVVYNGEGKYGQPGCEVYSYQNGQLTVEDVAATGFPCTFAITENGIVFGDTGKRTVTLETPGVIGFVKGEIKPFPMLSEKTAARWAAARIVFNNEEEGG